MLSNYPVHSIRLLNPQLPLMVFEPLLFHLHSTHPIYVLQKPKDITPLHLPDFEAILRNQLAHPIFSLPFDTLSQFTRDVLILHHASIIRSLCAYHDNFASYQLPKHHSIAFNQPLPPHFAIIRYHPSNQTHYLVQDITSLLQFVPDKHLRQALQQVRTLEQLKSLADLTEVGADPPYPQFQFENYQFIRDLKLSEALFKVYNADEYTEQQRLLFILLENYVNNIKIKPNDDPSISNYWLMFMKQKFDMVDSIELALIKGKNSQALDKLSFNKAFALELQGQHTQALDKFKKLYCQTSDSSLQKLITQRMTRIYENLKEFEQVTKLQLLFIHQQIKERGFGEQLYFQIANLHSDDPFYLQLGVRLEMSRNQEFPLLYKYLNTLSRQEKKKYIMKLLRESRDQLFLKLSFECRQMILIVLFEDGEFVLLNKLLEFSMDNLKHFGFQDHDFIILLFLKLMYAQGLGKGIENRIRMIKCEYEDQKRYLGGIDFDAINQLIAQVNYCRYKKIPPGLKEIDCDSFYLKYKYQKQNQNWKQMHQQWRNLAKKENPFRYKVLLNQGSKGLVELKKSIQSTLQTYGICHLKTVRLVYYYSKLLYKVGMYRESLQEFKTYLRAILGYMNEERVQVLMTCLQYQDDSIPKVLSLDYQIKLMLLKMCFGYRYQKQKTNLRRVYKVMLNYGALSFTQEFMKDYVDSYDVELLTMYKFNSTEIISWVDDL